MTHEQVLYAAVLGCVSAIVFLFGLEQARHRETREELKKARARLDACEIDRVELSSRIAVLEAGCRLANCPLVTKNL